MTDSIEFECFSYHWMSLFSMAHSRVMVVEAALSAKAAFECTNEDFSLLSINNKNVHGVQLGEAADNSQNSSERMDDK